MSFRTVVFVLVATLAFISCTPKGESADAANVHVDAVNSDAAKVDSTSPTSDASETSVGAVLESGTETGDATSSDSASSDAKHD